jgi:D-sedoheptulose 7-phosphate isomerase
MKNEIGQSRRILKDLLDEIVATKKGGSQRQLDEALEHVARMIIGRTSSGRKLLFIGNGGSASIASHLATDFCKNANMPALAFNDGALLTCLGNDLGYENVFGKPLELFAGSGDILFAISSSGKSMNILRGVMAARTAGSTVITFSGFSAANPLRKAGDVNFYVPSKEYGHVEIAHLSLCHCLADAVIKSGARTRNGRI